MIIAAAVTLVLAVAGAAGFGLGGTSGPAEPALRAGPAATATVTRQTLVQTMMLAGELSYGAPVPLASAASGTITWLPAVGSMVARGGTALRADELPVVLLYGALPMYRPLAEGTRGADVRQFERNLADLGYAGFTVDELFNAATAAAVRRWQKALKVSETGVVDRERVAYASGPIRVAGWLVRVGAAATGDVLLYTGDRRIVAVAAEPERIGWASAGVPVSVGLPSGAAIDGIIADVSTVVDPAAGQGQGQSGQGTSPGTRGATVMVTITVEDQQALGTLERSPVDVRYVADERKDVLTVPVPALLALAEGGYGVEVVTGSATRIVAVRAGLFANGRVEISGDGIAEGTIVGMPE